MATEPTQSFGTWGRTPQSYSNTRLIVMLAIVTLATALIMVLVNLYECKPSTGSLKKVIPIHFSIWAGELLFCTGGFFLCKAIRMEKEKEPAKTPTPAPEEEDDSTDEEDWRNRRIARKNSMEQEDTDYR